MSIVVINNALVMSQRTGESSGGQPKISMHISEKVYDAAYPQKLRYNNYWVTAHGELAAKVSHMGIKERSSVNVTCRMDFMEKIPESETRETSDGRSRFVKGLIFELLDISYAVSGISQHTCNEESGNEMSGKEASSVNAKRDVPVIDLDKNNILLEREPRGKVYGTKRQ